jgi:hypothetical protein
VAGQSARHERRVAGVASGEERSVRCQQACTDSPGGDDQWARAATVVESGRAQRCRLGS